MKFSTQALCVYQVGKFTEKSNPNHEVDNERATPNWDITLLEWRSWGCSGDLGAARYLLLSHSPLHEACTCGFLIHLYLDFL